MRTTWGLVRAVAMAAAVVAGLAVAAPPASAETSLDVSTPADDYHQAGATTPLLVTIEADRALTGTLTATFDGAFAGSQTVEVPGGSSKQVVFLVNSPPWSTSGQVTFDGGDEGERASARINLRTAGTDEVVAVLPSLATAREVPASAELAVAVGVARLYPFDPDLLTVGAEVLTPFSQLLGSTEDLAAMDPDQLEAVRAWVGTYGGTLVLDDAPGTTTPLELDPAAAGPDGATTYGVGSVRFSDGAAAAGRYDGLLTPTVSRSIDEFPFGPSQFGSVPTSILLAADAGVRIPAIGSLVGVLALYVVVAGPVLWLILRRTRRETFLWVALPLLALVTTLSVYGIGRALRSDTSAAHATVVADLPATRIVSSQVLVSSPNGGPAGVRLPDGWKPVSSMSDEALFGIRPGAGAAVQNQTVDGDSLVIDLPSGGVGVVNAETSQPVAEPSWRFDLSPIEDGLEGTVTNLTDRTLEEVFISSGQGFFRVADVGPGESAEVTLRQVNRPVVSSDRLMEHLMSGDPWSANDGAVNPGVLANWLARRPALRAPGHVLAVGWTRDDPSPLETVQGRPVANGRTAYLTAQRLDADDQSPSGTVELLRGVSTRVVDTPPAGACTDVTSTLRLVPSALVGDAVLEVQTRTVLALDLWDGDSWIPAGLAEEPPGGVVVLGVPLNQVGDGSAYVRLQMSCDFWGIADPFPTLRPATADDEVTQLAGAADQDGEA